MCPIVSISQLKSLCEYPYVRSVFILATLPFPIPTHIFHKYFIITIRQLH